MWNSFKSSSIFVKILILAIPLLLCAAVLAFFVLLSGIFEPTPPAVAPGPATPTVIPPAPTPTGEITFADWRGEYFNNPDLQGEPVLTRNDREINFNWGEAQPAPEVPAKNFSVRWTISRDVPAGIYRVTGTFDNGVRLWVDDNLITEDWQVGPVRTGSVDINLSAGNHTMRVEYSHREGPAVAQLRVDYLQDYPDWKAEYFNRPDFGSQPVVVRNELEINQNWGATSPIPGLVPDNNFAVRWSRTAEFDDAAYIFRIDVEGGVRVFLDGQMLLDSWGEQAFRQLEATSKLSKGAHALRVEYWKQSGNGQLRFGWARQESPDHPPVAVINGTSNAVVGQTVSFNARSSRVAEGSHLVSFEWDFGNGNRAKGVDVTQVYDTPGTFVVSLTVADDKGRRDTSTHQIKIDDRPSTPEPGQPPIPVIDAPSKAAVGDVVTFDSSRTISVNPIVRNAWEFGDGTRVDNAVKAQHTYQKPGVYRVKLTVEDDQGLKEVTYHQIDIQAAQPEPTPEPDQPPVARISAPGSVTAGEPFIVSASESQCAGSCTSFAWDMGDGTKNNNVVSWQHTYQEPGEYNITLTVTDDKGLQGTANHIIAVAPRPALPTVEAPTATPEPPQPEPPAIQPPTAVITGPTTAVVGQPVTFDCNSSTPGVGADKIVKCSWDLGDGNISTEKQVTHTYAVEGTYTVTLTVTQAPGDGTATATWQVVVQPQAGLMPEGEAGTHTEGSN